MLTLGNTKRGRLICVLGSALIAGMALMCLWWLSPSVTAGDDPLTKTDTTPKREVVSPRPDVPPLPPIAGVTLQPAAKNASTTDVQRTDRVAVPVMNPDSVPPPAPPHGTLIEAALAAPTARVTPPPAPAAESQDIKQLMTQLSEIRADRAKLDEKERQTILAIKRKYQDQKDSMEKLARESRQLGINCEETSSQQSQLRQAGATESLPPPTNTYGPYPEGKPAPEGR